MFFCLFSEEKRTFPVCEETSTFRSLEVLSRMYEHRSSTATNDASQKSRRGTPPHASTDPSGRDGTGEIFFLTSLLVECFEVVTPVLVDVLHVCIDSKHYRQKFMSPGEKNLLFLHFSSRNVQEPVVRRETFHQIISSRSRIRRFFDSKCFH